MVATAAATQATGMIPTVATVSAEPSATASIGFKHPVPRDDPSDSDSCEYGADSIVYPSDPRNSASIERIRAELSEETFHEARSNTLDFTAFFWVSELGDDLAEELSKMPEVSSLHF